jgi:hypothetical protein
MSPWQKIWHKNILMNMELIEQKEEIVSLLEDIRGQLRAELGERITEDWIIKVGGSFFFFFLPFSPL